MKYLLPKLSTLQTEYVLVQAFKKTVNHIRNHNWFADVLELDLATVDYPAFLRELRQDLGRPARWKSQRARLVPAPKSAPWWINKDGEWEPRPNAKGAKKALLRPLAHIPLRDQVIATAIMMCLADRVETLQGDPRLDVRHPANRRRVLSYGNRLFCDIATGKDRQQLRHRWGSAKLYRSYYADYRTFVSRPEIVAGDIAQRSNKKTVIVHSDLSKFYDRVRPHLLHTKIRKRLSVQDGQFLKFVRSVLNWRFDLRDKEAVQTVSDLPDFESLALPQGLVASGFFANIVLLDFDDALRASFDRPVAAGVILRDAARYVDDLRFVLEVPHSLNLQEIEGKCHRWIEGLLAKTAPGLTANGDKTRAVEMHDSKRVMVFQSRRMHRIQETVSGGFDAHGGTQLLAALEGLFNTIGQFVETDENGIRWPLKAVPDVRDETVARFVAGRYRTTFRSLRPLLEDEVIKPSDSEAGEDEQPIDVASAALTKEELDQQSQAFGLRLIEEWIRNPGNVRLLRVGLDLFPDPSVLESLIGLLKPLIASPQSGTESRLVAEYCLAELFRAAATETGLVRDQDMLPGGAEVEQYQDILRDYALALIDKQWGGLSWFCRQQILLFLAATSPVGVDVRIALEDAATIEYARLLAFLQGQSENDSTEWARHAVLARQSYLDADSADRLLAPQLTSERIASLALLAPAVAEELVAGNRRLRRLTDKSVLEFLSLPDGQPTVSALEHAVSLVEEARRWSCRLRDEVSLLKFAVAWLSQREEVNKLLAPSVIDVSFPTDRTQEVSFREPIDNRLFRAPTWCAAREKWRFELGFVLRFIITGQSDPTATSRHPSWRENEHCYRPPPWHWRVRRYSLYNGRDRLGPDWIPLSSWMESFLTGLLHWPGALLPSRPFQKLRTIEQAKTLCEARIRELENARGEATGLLMLPVTPRSVWTSQAKEAKSLRVCIAQLAVPEFRNGHPTTAFGAHDPEFNASPTRHLYQRHLTAMLAGIDQMLRVRATHRTTAGLDLLLLPELSVHPDDVRSRLLPFVRRHHCWVFAGLTYHRCRSGGPLVNSGLWIVPESSPQAGVLYRVYEQGKKYLAPEETAAFPGILQGHRPCQWLLRWTWSPKKTNRPVILSASICYDATDLALVSDLKKQSDIFVISALNRDVGTFDRMTEALHYHMYQMIILVNHAHFGGSNAYLPYREQYQKQVFHLHGQEEAIVAFLDVTDPGELINRGRSPSEARASNVWKTPPADWTPPAS
jgi:hypothetical protein